jgi:hypothetical protein
VNWLRATWSGLEWWNGVWDRWQIGAPARKFQQIQWETTRWLSLAAANAAMSPP